MYTTRVMLGIAWPRYIMRLMDAMDECRNTDQPAGGRAETVWFLWPDWLRKAKEPRRQPILLGLRGRMAYVNSDKQLSYALQGRRLAIVFRVYI